MRKIYIEPSSKIIRLESSVVMQEWLPNSFSHASGGSNGAPARQDRKPVF